MLDLMLRVWSPGYYAINVKRLRPVELGPFDYERLALWITAA